ncbi:MAG: hypothetical protein AB7E05_08505 [Sphingobium sp.]
MSNQLPKAPDNLADMLIFGVPRVPRLKTKDNSGTPAKIEGVAGVPPFGEVEHLPHLADSGGVPLKPAEMLDGTRGTPGTPDSGNSLKSWRDGIASLDPDTPRGGYDPSRWSRLVDDCHALLSGFGQSAASLGWTGIDLFGVPVAGAHAEYPFGGLAWRMKGGRVICIDEHQAVYRMPFSGAMARCARGFLDRRSGPFVPVWEMEQ